jgi:autotransporter-associated beta strand protein
MSLSKAVFLSSLTCFTLGIGSVFAGCDYCCNSCCGDGTSGDCSSSSIITVYNTGSACGDDTTCSATSSTTSGNGSCSFANAIECANINSNIETISLFVTSTDVWNDQANITADVSISSSSSVGTVLNATGNYNIIRMENDNTVTIGPEGSYPVSFGSGSIIDLSGGTLVFGPAVTFPSASNDLHQLTMIGTSSTDGPTLELQTSGTIGAPACIQYGTIFLNGDNLSVTFTGTLQCIGLITISGSSNSSQFFLSPDTSNQQLADLLIDTVTCVVNSTIESGSGTITLQSTGTEYGTLQSNETLTLGINYGITLDGQAQILAAEPAVFTVSSNITDDGAGLPLMIGGGGTVHLQGSNSYSGGTTVEGATLEISSSNNVSSGDITLNSGAILEITGDVSLGSLTNNAGAPINVNSKDNVTFSGGILGSGDFEVTASSSDTFGTFSVGGAPSSFYEGTISLSSMNFEITSATTTSKDMGIILSNEADFSLTFASGTATIGNLSMSTTTISLGTASLNIYQTDSSTNMSSVISGSGGMGFFNGNTSQAKNLTINLTGKNTYTGATTIGPYVTLEMKDLDNIGAGQLNMQGPAQLTVGSSGITLPSTVVLESGTCTFDLSNNVALTIDEVVSGSGGLYVSSSS